MKLIKNNWLKIVLATLCIVSTILLLIPSFMAENLNFIGACQTIGLILFFIGIGIVLCISINDKAKTLSRFSLLITGALVLVFLSIGMSGLSKTDAQGVIGKSYAYFASVEETVNDGEETLTAKQAELNAKRHELETAKVEITTLGLLAKNWSTTAAGYLTPDLFGTMVDDVFVSTIDPTTTTLGSIVLNPLITSEHPAYGSASQLIAIKSQLVMIGLKDQTLQTAPYVMGGIIEASSQSFPKLEEAIAQLQGVIDMNAGELTVGKNQINDANAAAATIMSLYICLILGLGIGPIIISTKLLICKKS